MGIKFQAKISKAFGNKLRLRVCGILIENNQTLLVKHHGMGKNGFWSPPGGAVKFGERIEKALKREFYEETGLFIRMGDFLFLNEFMKDSLHAIELFFKVEKIGGSIIKGEEPEIQDASFIEEIAYLDMEKIKSISNEDKHQLFWGLDSLKEIEKLKGLID